jgi:hypothetical protein
LTCLLRRKFKMAHALRINFTPPHGLTRPHLI